MATATISRATAASSVLRSERRRQRLALREAPPSEVVRAIVDPPPELASYRLIHLFGNTYGGAIPGFSTGRLRAALRRLNRENPYGRRWSEQIRLGGLSRGDRQLLVAAITRHSPPTWSEAA